MRILMHSPQSSGGVAEYTRCQFAALRKAGADVVLLCPTDFADHGLPAGSVQRLYHPLVKRAPGENVLTRGLRLGRNVFRFLANQWKLAWEVFRKKPDVVLLDSYMEYLSPLWIWPHTLLARIRGTTYVATLHDPVRDFVVGPRWWHNWSVALAYSPLKVGIIHEKLPDHCSIPSHVAVHEAPHGLYDLKECTADAAQIRRSWGVPSGAVTFLSFGFIRDNKNLDLLIEALKNDDRVFLAVIGSAQSSANRPLQFYRDLAIRCGVEDRVLFREEFVPDAGLANYFAAADFVVMTYNSTFHSQSGVLNIAAKARRRVLASSGEGPLQTCVRRFHLGEFVEPDNLDALVAGMKRLCRQHAGQEETSSPDWQGYEAYASWDANARIILDAVKEARNKI